MMAYRRHRGMLPALLLLAAIVASGSVTPVSADVGVAIDIGAIDVSQRLSKGGRYQLPTIGVRNPGTEASAYAMDVSFIQGQAGRRVPPAWFTFTPATFTLEPGATQAVRVSVEIPANAPPDAYKALLEARVATPGEGARVGAAAASQLSFTVKPSTVLEAWLLRGRLTLDGGAPWSYLLLALLLLGSALWWVRGRFRLDLRVQRRR